MEPASTSTPLPQSSNDNVPVLSEKQESSTSLTSSVVPDESETHIRLAAVSQNGESLQFKVRMTTPLQKIINAYCDRMSISVDSVRFLYDGVRVDGEGTAKSHKMEDGDILDVVLQQSGGGKVL